jgi:hypothetical protein
MDGKFEKNFQNLFSWIIVPILALALSNLIHSLSSLLPFLAKLQQIDIVKTVIIPLFSNGKINKK